MQARLGFDHEMGAELSCAAKRGSRGDRIRINSKTLPGVFVAIFSRIGPLRRWTCEIEVGEARSRGCTELTEARYLVLCDD